MAGSTIARATPLLLLVGIASCSERVREVERYSYSSSALAAPTSSSRAPRPAYEVYSLKSILEQTAAVVEGTVSSVTYSFDSTGGPRTNVTLGNLVVRLGTLPSNPATLSLPMFGGPDPNGRFYESPELANFGVGATYVVLLANHDWFFSPVLRDFAFRVETINGIEVLIDQTGHGITGVTADGFTRTATLFAQPAGREHAHRFDVPPLLAVSATDVQTCLPKDEFIARLATWDAPGMKSTRFDGSYVSIPMNSMAWNYVPGSPGAGQLPSDAGGDVGP